MADSKYAKFKKQESRNHERLLKIIIQMYKPKIKPRPKATVIEKPLESASDSSSSREETPIIAVEPLLMNKEKRAKQAESILKGRFNSIAQEYIDGQITLEELKAKEFRLNKYLSHERSESAPAQSRKRKPCQYYREEESEAKPMPTTTTATVRKKPWNFSLKVETPKYEPLFLKPTVNEKEKSFSIHEKPWCSSFRADHSLITDQYRSIAVTNDRNFFKTPNLKHGGRLSAKSMHDMLVEAIYPGVKASNDTPKENSVVSCAVKSAKKRIVDYQSKHSKPRSRPVSAYLLRNK